jgi:NADPH2:quinone reductase
MANEGVIKPHVIMRELPLDQWREAFDLLAESQGGR